MSRDTVRSFDGEMLWTKYERGNGNETVAIGEWKRCLDKNGGDGFAAAREFKATQPALFRILEGSNKSFEELVELSGLMSGNDAIDRGEYF